MSGFDFLRLDKKCRRKIVDKMRSVDRCRFALCSKLCYRLATASKNALEGVALRGFAPHLLRVTLNFGVDENGFRIGYFLDFVIDLGTGDKYVVYYKMMPNNDHQVIWRAPCDAGDNMTFVALRYFTRRVKWYKLAIKTLLISIPYIRDPLSGNVNYIDINYRELLRLARLELGDETIMPFVFASLRRPLRDFRTPVAHATLPNEVCQVLDTLIAPRSRLNAFQFRRLFASRVEIAIGDLTADTIVAFIRSWQRGECRRNFVKCIWHTANSVALPFCKRDMMFALGIGEHVWRHYSQFRVASFNDPRRVAFLFHNDHVLVFSVDQV